MVNIFGKKHKKNGKWYIKQIGSIWCVFEPKNNISLNLIHIYEWVWVWV